MLIPLLPRVGISDVVRQPKYPPSPLSSIPVVVPGVQSKGVTCAKTEVVATKARTAAAMVEENIVNVGKGKIGIEIEAEIPNLS